MFSCLGIAASLLVMVGCGRTDSRWAKGAPARRVPPVADGLDEFRAEIRREPKSSDAHVRLAAEYFKRDRLYEAAEEFGKGLLLDHQNTEALLGLRHAMAMLEDSANTLSLAEQAMQLSPESPFAQAVIAEAARTFDRALAIHPHDPYLLVRAANCEGKLKHWDKAEKYYRHAAEVAPTLMSPRLMLGNLYLQQGLIGEAASEFEYVVKEQRSSAIGHQALGGVRRLQNRNAEALAEFVEAQRLRPKWIVPFHDAGSICLQMEKYDDALIHFRKALEISPGSPVAQAGLGEVWMVKGEENKAIDAYEKLLVDYPKQPIVLNNLANLYAKRKMFDRAMELAKRAVNVQPYSGIVRDTVGWISHLAGQDREALMHLQEAARFSPKNALIHYHLAKVLLVAGRQSEAAESLRVSLSSGLPTSEKADAERLLANP